MSSDYAMGTPLGDAVYNVRQSGAREWQIAGGLVDDSDPTPTASGCIFGRDSSTFPLAFVVDDSGAEGMLGTDDMWAAVTAFAHATRVVEATEEGRAIAARWQSSGTVGHVLATFASTGRARLDLLRYDADRTIAMDAGAAEDMAQLFTSGYREPVTVRSIAEDVVRENGTESYAATVSAVLSVVAEREAHLITDAASARDALGDIETAFENAEPSEFD